jgi:hypothetical protein
VHEGSRRGISTGKTFVTRLAVFILLVLLVIAGIVALFLFWYVLWWYWHAVDSDWSADSPFG